MRQRDSTRSGWQGKAPSLPRLTHRLADINLKGYVLFGLVSAPKILHRAITEMFEDTEKCVVIVDDSLVWEKVKKSMTSRWRRF